MSMSQTSNMSTDEIICETKSSLTILKSLQNNDKYNHLFKDNYELSDISICDETLLLYKKCLRKVELGIGEAEIILQLYDFLQISDGERYILYRQFKALKEEENRFNDELTSVRLQLEDSEKMVCQLEEHNKDLQLQFMDESKSYESIDDQKDKKLPKIIFPIKDSSDILFYRAFDVPRKAYKLNQMKKLVDMDDDIIEAWRYKNRLTWYQLTFFKMNHQFIVFKTNTYYWSMETKQNIIQIQISELMGDVVNRICSGEERLRSITQLDSTRGNIKVGDLISFLETFKERRNHNFATEIYRKIKESF